MVLSDFFVPCGLLLGTVFVSFLLMCWFFQATYIKSLQRRVKRLEHLVEPSSRNTTGDVAFQARAPRPIQPSRYVTVDRKIKPEYYR